MFFPLIKANIAKKPFRLYNSFVLKSNFLDLEFKKRSSYKYFRVDYLPIVNNRIKYQSFVRAWYLVLALRTVKVFLIAGKMPVFSYRRTKMFSKYQEVYALSLNKHFYETLVEHRNVFYCLTVSAFSIDKLYFILCLYHFKKKLVKSITILKKKISTSSSHNELVNFISHKKWKFKIVEFI